ncbi:hypothetical protein [Chitinophaga sp. MM2321]|uniref:hypothetical protein n=1 Tax=Chitinophaga sp. MM2321 TaxID=3137178 RepID=UPI0032D58845
MRFLYTLFIILSSSSLLAQDFPKSDYFSPYKYPAAYSFDGAYNILEIYGHIPDDKGYGGGMMIDFKSFKLGTPAVRLNLGFGLGYQTVTNKITFPGTPLLNDGIGENFLKDDYQIPHFQLYPRLWIRLLNPLNISLAGGPAAGYITNVTTGHFSVHDNSVWENQVHVLEPEAKSSTFEIGYFYEAKLMLNIKNWGVSAGVGANSLRKNTGMIPSVGIWFGLNKPSAVNN